MRKYWQLSWLMFIYPFDTSCNVWWQFHEQLQIRLIHQGRVRLKSSNLMIHNLFYHKNHTLCNTITLYVTVIVFTGPNESTLWFHHIGDHIINQSMFIPDFLFFELFLVLFLINSLEDILEFTIIFFQYSVFSG